MNYSMAQAGYPRRYRRRATIPLLFALIARGVFQRRPLLAARWAFTPPFHPYHRYADGGYFLLHFPSAWHRSWSGQTARDSTADASTVRELPGTSLYANPNFLPRFPIVCHCLGGVAGSRPSCHKLFGWCHAYRTGVRASDVVIITAAATVQHHPNLLYHDVEGTGRGGVESAPFECQREYSTPVLSQRSGTGREDG